MNLVSEKVLITGGSGYLGQKVLIKFLELGYECSVLDINKPESNFDSKINYFQVDIRDKTKVIDSCKGINIIVHCVAQVPLAKNKHLFKSVNYFGTQNILEASLINNVSHLIYISSSAVYGVPEINPVFEYSPTIPCEEYGKAKLDGEKLVHEYQRKGVNTSIIRPRTILGPGRLGIFQILFEWVYQGRNIPVFDGGKNIYQFIHSDDLVNAIVLCCRKKAFDVFNVGAEEYCSMYETLNSVIKHSKSKSKIRSLNSNLVIPFMNFFSFTGLSPLGAYHAKMYGKSLFFDTSKSNKKLNWKSKFSNIRMMKENYDWYILNRKDIFESTDRKSHHSSLVRQKILKLVGKLI